MIKPNKKMNVFNLYSYLFNNRPEQDFAFLSPCQGKPKNPKSKKASSWNTEIQLKWDFPVSFVGIVSRTVSLGG